MIAAASFLQARIIFDHFLGLLGGKVEDKKEWRVWDGTAAARLLHVPSGASVRCIASDPKRMHGLAPVLVLADEPAQWETNRSEAALAAVRTGPGEETGRVAYCAGNLTGGRSRWIVQIAKGQRHEHGGRCASAAPREPRGRP